MKTQISMIPLTAIILMLIKSLGFSMEPPKTSSIHNQIIFEEAFQENNATYPILSNKNYQYTAEVKQETSDIIIFIFEDVAIATLTRDKDGNYTENIEYIYTSKNTNNKSTENQVNDRTNLLDKLRNHTHALILNACNTAFKQRTNLTNTEIQEKTQSDGKYFRSDYNNK